MRPYLWTRLKARLKYIKSKQGASLHWLFLAGGPGLGSESLAGLTNLLDLPGTIWHLDLPGDGSNTTTDDSYFFSQWQEALIEVVDSLDQVILVGHSTGGMYALATKALATRLKGLVLIASAPDCRWQSHFAAYAEQHPLPEMSTLLETYVKNPSNKVLKALTIAAADYSFSSQNLDKGKALLETLPFNYKSCAWSDKHFDASYKATWIPQIPTLICGGDEDKIIPLSLFQHAADFQTPHILIREIKKASHFPWMDNPKAILNAFHDYIKHFQLG